MPEPTLALRNVTFMTERPAQLADFWQSVLRLPQRKESDDEVILAETGWPYPRYTFQRVSDVRSAAPIHLDLLAGDRVAEVRRLVGLGAVEVRTVENDGVTWTVMRDPDGNEFCVTG